MIWGRILLTPIPASNPVSANKSTPGLPYILAIFDDFAQIPMQYGLECMEEPLQPTLTIGRTVGIYSIILTSLPTSKIVPSSLKANIPSRLSFRVSTKSNSRMALDMNGTENLRAQKN